MIGACTFLLAVAGLPARAHGEAVEVVVEGLARGGEDLGVVDYGISITFLDGDAMTGAEIDISVEPSDDVAVDPVTETVSGIYIGRVQFPGTGEWRVTIEFDSPDSSGSVQFTQTVREPAPQAPVVMVDTLEPDRVGTVAVEATSILGPGGQEVQVGDHRFPIVVEAFIETAEAPLVIDYAALVEGAEESSIELSAESDQGDVVEAVELTDTDGVHRTRIVYPSAALWTVTMTIDTGSGVETLTFKESLPWPHYTTEAGHPKVKYDSESPGRIGTIADEDSSVYMQETAAAPTTQTTQPTEEPSTTAPTEQDDVVVNVTEPADELRLNIALRVVHVAALGLWVVPLVASALGREHRLSVISVLSGMVLTAITGLSLALWGAPVAFPGLLRWEDLANRLYGDSYLIAFLAKMAMAGVAVVATVVWASRRSTLAVFVTFGGLAAALVAVTAMSQFHLFSHL